MALNIKEAIRPVAETWAAALTFNKSLLIPVRWKRATTVSGVSKRTGAPIEGRTGHILLMEDWGEQKRGEFLCGAKIVNPLAHRLFNMGERDIEISKRERVTCRKCLKAAERMRKTGAA